jgi:uncharacterized phage protein (TIGR02220 family)
MANRFTDTEKWGDSWFRNLPWGWKSVWLYLCDRCDHAGIIKIDLELLNFYIKPDKPLDIEQILGAINNGKERVIRVDDSRLYLTQFVEFQYKGGFNPNNNAHLGVVKLLRRYQLTKHLPRGWSGANKGLVRGSVATKDKDKDKEDTKYIDTANKVIDYFNKTTESSYKHSSTARGPIIARLKDGFTGRQCAEVIHKKHHQWKDDDKMCKYIRITTLFQPTKFEGYLNEKTVVEPEKRML